MFVALCVCACACAAQAERIAVDSIRRRYKNKEEALLVKSERALVTIVKKSVGIEEGYEKGSPFLCDFV